MQLRTSGLLIRPAIETEKQREGGKMSVARITEISSASDTSFEDAIEQGIARAARTLHNIRSAWVKEQEVQVDGGRITSYKVIMKITFVLDE
jgi:dodecin